MWCQRHERRSSADPALAAPLLGAIGVLLIPKQAESAIKGTALAITLATFVLTLVAYGTYVQPGSRASAPLRERAERNSLESTTSTEAPTASEVGPAVGDLVVRRTWIPYFNIQYYLGLDGISLSLVLLTGLVSVLACLASWNIDKQVKGYFSLFLLLTASMMGVFLSLDMFLFYVFFEVMLLPMYFLIGVWGGENREYAAIKFLLYTLFGSVFILVAILLLYFWPGEALAPGAPQALLHGQAFTAPRSISSLWPRLPSETNYYGASVQRHGSSSSS